MPAWRSRSDAAGESACSATLPKTDSRSIRWAKIEWNLRMLGRLEPEKTRLFLLGENAFCLSFEQLSQIFALAKTFMPNVREFAMYARIDDVLRKTPEELRQLREMGLSDLHIGVESGSDPILLWMNKGVTSFEMLQAFKMLDRAEIGYFITIILGLGGKYYRNLHAIETANLLNRIHPKMCLGAQAEDMGGHSFGKDGQKRRVCPHEQPGHPV